MVPSITFNTAGLTHYSKAEQLHECEASLVSSISSACLECLSKWIMVTHLELLLLPDTPHVPLVLFVARLLIHRLLGFHSLIWWTSASSSFHSWAHLECLPILSFAVPASEPSEDAHLDGLAGRTNGIDRGIAAQLQMWEKCSY